MRYNSIGNTIDYCNGTSWASLGVASATTVAFRARITSNQSGNQNTGTKLIWSIEDFDTNNNFNPRQGPSRRQCPVSTS